MGKIETAVAQKTPAAEVQAQKQSVNQLMNSFLDGEGLRKRFDDLLGKRSAQFVSSIVSLVNADDNMKSAFYEQPMSIIQSALKAASFDLPIDQNLGYAYLVPFRTKGKMTCTFILGWKGMHQLALRTGAYKCINVVDVRQGELKSYNRLTEEIELDFVDDDEQREALPIIGYVGYYRLVNGAEKTIYMTIKQIQAHELKNRKGEYMGKGWREDFDAMARKTVYRRLIGKWGVMSIEYQSQGQGNLIANQMSDAINNGSVAEPIDVTYEEGETLYGEDAEAGDS